MKTDILLWAFNRNRSSTTPAMTTPNHQPAPPSGMTILTDYTKPLPHPCFVWCGDIDGPVEWMPLVEPDIRVDSIPHLEDIYAIPTVPATGDTTNEKGGEPCLDLTEANALTVSSNAALDVPSVEQRPIPEALYPCKWCAEDYSRPADELFWSEDQKAWVCRECWDYRDSGNLGPSLQQEIESRK